jgi:hypothetical protein
MFLNVKKLGNRLPERKWHCKYEDWAIEKKYDRSQKQ